MSLFYIFEDLKMPFLLYKKYSSFSLTESNYFILVIWNRLFYFVHHVSEGTYNHFKLNI
jgi:hypothetical protein